MAITATRVGFVPPPASAGCEGIEIFRLLGDAAATSIVITLGADSNVKTIKSVLVGGNVAASHNITVATTNAVTITFTSAPSATTFDVWIFGQGR